MASQDFKFGPAFRLHGRSAFARVYAGKTRKNAGPITAYGVPNDLDRLRLGLSVPRAVGTAVRRSRIKRLLREAFRLTRHQWPRGYDVIVVVRPHPPAQLADYQRMLGGVVRELDVQWARRRRGEGSNG